MLTEPIQQELADKASQLSTIESSRVEPDRTEEAKPI
jgi:hypothetical protein